ncbi:hypothetical protein DPMN_155742 [Dreissena polymorpha]|uniref:Uncharacterized protein n=1 Tax=Dreissena polymorpha TaxID=45954 RepID=A0A9D4FMR9_DREPO|nr:hypothetical protein DPMN_155742 [Dreissena polymorpha]
MCCSPSTVPREFLDPVLDDDSIHYKQYYQVEEVETTEDDRPSYHKPVLDDTQAAGNRTPRRRKSSGIRRCFNLRTNALPMTAQTARYLIVLRM